MENALQRQTDYVYNNRDWVTRPPARSGRQRTLEPSGDQRDLRRRGTRGCPQTDPLDNVTALTYDHEGRVLSVTRPDPDDGGPLSAPVESYTYNALGSVLTVTDPGGARDQLAV